MPDVVPSWLAGVRGCIPIVDSGARVGVDSVLLHEDALGNPDVVPVYGYTTVKWPSNRVT